MAPDKKLEHCTTCNQMTNHYDGVCLTHDKELTRVLNSLRVGECVTGFQIADIRSAIQSYAEGMVREERERIKDSLDSILEDYFLTRTPYCEPGIIAGYIKEALTPPLTR